MSKKQVKSDFHVIIWPKGCSWIPTTHEDYEKTCQEIKRQVKRHIDNVASVAIVYDSEWICEYCNRLWEEDENGLPVCCDKAQEKFHQNLSKD